MCDCEQCKELPNSQELGHRELRETIKLHFQCKHCPWILSHHQIWCKDKLERWINAMRLSLIRNNFYKKNNLNQER